jgi:hypothetical protein
VALARIEDAWVLSFVVERHPSGLFTVFVPSAPTPAAGSIYYLTAERLKLLDVSVSTAVGCIMRLGIGSHELLDSRPQLVAELVHYNGHPGEQSLRSGVAPQERSGPRVTDTCANLVCRASHRLIAEVPESPSAGAGFVAGAMNHCSFGTTLGWAGSPSYAGVIIWMPYSLKTSRMFWWSAV